MIVEIRDAGGNTVSAPANATMTVTGYDAEAVGGPKSAEMTLVGPQSALWQATRWLGHRITILADNGQRVWYGMLHEVTIATGSIEVGLSLANMYNRVAVAYTYEPPGGAVERATTDWAENSESVLRYGYKELMYSMSDTNLTQAEAQRDTLLTAFGQPPPVLRITPGGTPMATLRCIGLYDTLDWRYYSNSAGKEEHSAGGQQQPVGQGFTASTIGFTSDGRIHDSGNRLDELLSDIRVQVTGSGSNNGAHLITGRGADGENYTASTISFDTTDDVLDSASGMGFLSSDDIITISGSASNNGTMRVKSAAADHITVTQSISTESAGASVTIAQFGSVITETTFTNELPSASVTITAHGQKVAQSFTLAANHTWTVDKIEINCKKVGSPADNLKVELCSDSAGSPGSALVSATVAAAGIGTDSDWIEFDMGNTQSITYGTTYWIVVSRTGSNEIANYYVVDVDEDLGYSGGSLKVYTGSAWTTRYNDADMAFRILGAELTTTQISSIYSSAGQFFSAIDVVDSSGVYGNQYREGDKTAKAEIDDLISSGTSGTSRLLATVTPDAVLKIYAQPSTSEADIVLRSNGQIGWPSGGLITSGWLPVGRWIQLADIPRSVDALASLANIFIERADYRDGQLQIEPQGMPTPWDVGKL